MLVDALRAALRTRRRHAWARAPCDALMRAASTRRLALHAALRARVDAWNTRLHASRHRVAHDAPALTNDAHPLRARPLDGL